MILSLINILKKERNSILNVLLQVESIETAEEEINVSINALENYQDNYLNKCNNCCVFLPMNLPLYSLVTYVILPRLNASTVVYRCSNIMKDISVTLHKILNLDLYNIHLFNGSRNSYIKNYVQNSDVTVFIGKYENAISVQNVIKDDC